MLTLFLCGVLAQAEHEIRHTTPSNSPYVVVEEKPTEAKETWSRTYEPDDLTLTLYAISYDDLLQNEKETWYTPTGTRLKGRLAKRIFFDARSDRRVAHVNLLFRLSANQDRLPNISITNREDADRSGVGTWIHATGVEGIEASERCYLLTCHFEKLVASIDVTWYPNGAPWEMIYSGPIQKSVTLTLLEDETKDVIVRPTIKSTFGHRDLTVVLVHRQPNKTFFVHVNHSGPRPSWDPSFSFSLSSVVVDRLLVGDECIEQFCYSDLAGNTEGIEVYRGEGAMFTIPNIPATRLALLQGNNEGNDGILETPQSPIESTSLDEGGIPLLPPLDNDEIGLISLDPPQNADDGVVRLSDWNGNPEAGLGDVLLMLLGSLIFPDIVDATGDDAESLPMPPVKNLGEEFLDPAFTVEADSVVADGWSRTYEPENFTLTLYAVMAGKLERETPQKWHTPDGIPLKGAIVVASKWPHHPELPANIPGFSHDIKSEYVQLLFATRSTEAKELMLSGARHDGGPRLWMNVDRVKIKGLEGANPDLQYYWATCDIGRACSAIDVTWYAKREPWERIYCGRVDKDVTLRNTGDRKNSVVIRSFTKFRSLQGSFETGVTSEINDLSVMLVHQQPDYEYYVQSRHVGDSKNFPGRYDPFATEEKSSRLQTGGNCFDVFPFLKASEEDGKKVLIDVYRRKSASLHFRNIPTSVDPRQNSAEPNKLK